MVCLSGFNATYTRPYIYGYTATGLMSSHVHYYVLNKADIHDATMYLATTTDNIVARYNFVAGTRSASPKPTFS